MEISQINEEEIIDEITYNILNDPFVVFSQDSSYTDVQIKATAIQGLLDLYKKKSKMVDLMAENLTTPTHNKEWVIKYFEDEVNLE